jgi:hypothetical protein
MDNPSDFKEPLPESQSFNRSVVGDDDQCLAAGTLVTTPDGDKPIEEIKAGDLVLSGIGSNKTGFHEVKKMSEKPYHGPMLHVTADTGHKFSATPNHICFSTFPKHIPEDEVIFLFAWDGYEKNNAVSHYVSCMADSEIGPFDDIDKAEEAAHRELQEQGEGCIERIAIFNSTKGLHFMPAADLTVGMELAVVDDKLVDRENITSIVEEEYNGLVYDLDVPTIRNFAANGVLVHDSTLM